MGQEEFSKMFSYLFEMPIIILNLWEFCIYGVEKKQGRCHKTMLNQSLFVILFDLVEFGVNKIHSFSLGLLHV